MSKHSREVMYASQGTEARLDRYPQYLSTPCNLDADMWHWSWRIMRVGAVAEEMSTVAAEGGTV